MECMPAVLRDSSLEITLAFCCSLADWNPVALLHLIICMSIGTGGGAQEWADERTYLIGTEAIRNSMREGSDSGLHCSSAIDHPYQFSPFYLQFQCTYSSFYFLQGSQSGEKQKHLRAEKYDIHFSL